jgi:hypothetical protein
MTDPAPSDDSGLRAEDRTLRRRRLAAAAVTVAALVAVAAGSAVGSVVSAHEDRAVGVSHQTVVGGP